MNEKIQYIVRHADGYLALCNSPETVWEQLQRMGVISDLRDFEYAENGDVFPFGRVTVTALVGV